MSQRRTAPPRGTRKKYQVEMTSLSLFLWGFCLCFLLAWIFVLGILVGRGFLPGAVSAISDLKGQIERLQGMVSHSRAPNTGAQKNADADPKLDFYKNLSSKKDEIRKKGPTEEKVEVRKPEVSKVEVPPAKVEPSHKAPPPAEKGEEIKVTSRQPETVPARSNGIQYTVQLASLEERSKAEGMIRQLKDRGFDAYFYEVTVKGKTYYRVRCGRFGSREEADVYARRLADDAGMKGFVSKME